MSDVLVLGYEDAHRYVDRTKRARWEGWDIVIFSPNEHGWNNVKGAFRNGRWGMEQRVTVNGDGNWIVKQFKRKANA